MKKVLLQSILEQFIALIVICCITEAAELRCNILQYKTDRFYFPHGEEDNVFPGCEFTIYNREDSIYYAGYIENSHPGISYSYPTSVKFDTVVLADLVGRISTALIDSQSVITLGILSDNKIEDFFNVSMFEDRHKIGDSSYCTDAGNSINFRSFSSFFAMTLAFEQGEIDGFASYKKPAVQSRKAEIISTPAMYFAAMVPNVSSSFNEKGVLSTSLYYRFNPKLFAYYYKGDDLHPFNRLYLREELPERLYDYNPAKGKSLLSVLDMTGRSVKIHFSHPHLKTIAEYFVDILSRDRVNASVDSADLYMTYIPLDSLNPGESLDSIHTILLQDAAIGGRAEMDLDIVENYIELGMNSDNHDSRMRYFKKAEQDLMESFGVLPLYRPTHFFAFGNHIKNAWFDADSRIDLLNLKYIILPSDNKEAHK